MHTPSWSTTPHRWAPSAQHPGGLAAGSITFFVDDVRRAARAGSPRPAPLSRPGQRPLPRGAALALGALLDGIPESAAIGVTILQGGAPSTAFIAAVASSKLPEGLSSGPG